ncbi:MAG: hypothetical protein KBC95_03165, partial [Candidatus Peribacteraceae bacterium]|nr:hypothetical protein [Candidatus Peribacteraceae bacterium]
PMVTVHMFRTAFSAGTRERRLLGMAGEAPFTTEAELNAEASRVEARLNNEPHDPATHEAVAAEVRVTKIRLVLTQASPTLRTAATDAIARLTTAESNREAARATLLALRTTQAAKRADILGKLNGAATDRTTGLSDARTEINASLAQINTLATATPVRNDLIAQHTAHINDIQNLAPTRALTPAEKSPLMTTLATETGADAASKERLGFHYLRSVGYQESGGNLVFTKVYPGAGADTAPRTITLTYTFDNTAPGMWKVAGSIGRVAIPQVPAATLNRAHIDALITADAANGPAAAALINTTAGVALADINTHLIIALNVKDGINTAPPVTTNQDVVRNGAVTFEATRATQELQALTASHTTFKTNLLTPAFIVANRAKTEAAALEPAARLPHILRALDLPAPDGLRAVATAQKNLLTLQISQLAVPTPPRIVPSNVVARIGELRRQITDIDNILRAREVELGVTTAPATTPATAPAESLEVRNFRTAVDAAINPLSATSTRTQLDAAQTLLGTALTTLPAAQRDTNKNYIVERARAKGLTAVITGTTVALTVAPAGSTPERPAATVPSFLEALNNPRQLLQFLRVLAPMLSMLSGRGMSSEALSVAFDRMDLQLQLRDAEARLVAFDRANPSRTALTEILRGQRTAIETEIADIRRRIAALPATPAISGAPATGSESAESIAAFATNAAAAINRYLAPNVASVVGNRYIVINCVGKPPEVVSRMNGLMVRYGSAVPATGTAGLPEGANRPNSNIIAFDAVTLSRMVSGDVNAIVRAPTPFTTAPASGPATGPVAAPIVSASSVAGVGGIPPKPVLGASSRRAS